MTRRQHCGLTCCHSTPILMSTRLALIAIFPYSAANRALIKRTIWCHWTAASRKVVIFNG